MSKKDYELAARVTQGFHSGPRYEAVMEAFTTFFLSDDNPRFDLERFRRACVPGANVKARS